MICICLPFPSIGQETVSYDTLKLNQEILRSRQQQEKEYESWVENIYLDVTEKMRSDVKSKNSSFIKGNGLQQMSSLDGCEENSSNLTVSQFNALIDLYESTTINSNWTNSTGWDTAVRGVVEDIKCWYGVKINSSGDLIELTLDNNNLNGTLPSSLGNISTLSGLVIPNNPQLTGSIPESIGKMTNLVYINLSRNNFTGNLPDSIGYNTELISLLLFWNPNLQGEIPQSMENLVKLENFLMEDTNVGDTIPEIFGAMENLETVILGRNNFIGPIPSQYHPNSSLVTLNLANNNLSDSIPPSLGSLSNLGSLHLENNQLTKVLPGSLSNLSNLQELYVTGNKLDSIATDFSNMINLKKVHLSDNDIEGGVPTSLFSLSGLEELMFFENEFTGSLPDPSAMTSLRKFTSYSNFLAGPIPPGFANLPNLITFNIGFNGFTGTIPEGFMCGRPWIKEFNIGGNPEIYGEIPSCLSGTLMKLDLYKCSFTFEDIVPIKSNFTGGAMIYKEQQKVGEPRTESAYYGFPYLLEAAIDLNTPAASLFQWFKRGPGDTEIPLHPEPTSEARTFEIGPLDSLDAGNYFYKIWNEEAPGLILTSRDVTISITNKAPLAASILVTNLYCGQAFLPVIEGDEECSPIAVAYSWDFGDSLGSGDRRPVHQYATSGNYDVEVEISYRCGNTFVFTTTASRTITDNGFEALPIDFFSEEIITVYSQASQEVLQAEASTFQSDWHALFADRELNEMNVYENGTAGVWRNSSSLYYDTDREQKTIPDVSSDGTFLLAGFDWQYPELEAVSDWTTSGEMTAYSSSSQPKETRDVLGIYSSSLYGYGEELLIAQGVNSRNLEMAFTGFEPKEGASTGNWRFEDEEISLTERYRVLNGKGYFATVDMPVALLSGLTSVDIITSSGRQKAFSGSDIPVLCIREDPRNEFRSIVTFGSLVSDDYWTGEMVVSKILGEDVDASIDTISHTGFASLKVEGTETFHQDIMRLEEMKTYHFSAWITIGSNPSKPFITGGASAELVFRDKDGVEVGDSWIVYPSGPIIEGWQQLKGDFDFPENAITYDLSFNSGSHAILWVDDLRLFPIDANMQSYVYDYSSHRLVATLDAENFSTYYYYDNEGNLRLVKKETVSGIVTLSETEQYLIEREP